MADVDHPKTHVEDQKLKSPRKQPISPQHEGIDPLTESDKMYPREDVKSNAEKFNEKEAKRAKKDVEATDTETSVVEDQENRDAKIAAQGGEKETESETEAHAPKGKDSGTTTSSR